MYANIRRWRVPADHLDRTFHLADTHIAEQLPRQPGFVAFEAMVTDGGEICSVTIFEDRDGVVRSHDLALDFVRDQLAGVPIEEGESLVGRIMVSRAREHVLEATHH